MALPKKPPIMPEGLSDEKKEFLNREEIRTMQKDISGLRESEAREERVRISSLKTSEEKEKQKEKLKETEKRREERREVEKREEERKEVLRADRKEQTKRLDEQNIMEEKLRAGSIKKGFSEIQEREEEERRAFLKRVQFKAEEKKEEPEEKIEPLELKQEIKPEVEPTPTPTPTPIPTPEPEPKLEQKPEPAPIEKLEPKFETKTEEIPQPKEELKKEIKPELEKNTEVEKEISVVKTELSKILSERKALEIKKQEIVSKKEEVKNSLLEIAEKENKIEAKEKEIEEKEKAATKEEKRKLEEMRWKVQDIRKSVEKKRWELEELQPELENQEKEITSQYQNFSNQIEEKDGKIKELEKNLWQEKKAEVQPAEKIEVPPKEETTPVAPPPTPPGTPPVVSPSPTPPPPPNLPTEKESKRPFFPPKKPSSEFEEELTLIPKRQIKKQSFFEKLVVRIIIVFLICSILANVFLLWYWYLKNRGLSPQDSSPEETFQEEVMDKPEEISLVIPASLIDVTRTETLKVSNEEELKKALNDFLGNDFTEESFTRIVIESSPNSSQKTIAGIKEFFDFFGIKTPSGLLEKLNNDFTLFVYSNNNLNRLGFVAKIKEGEEINNLLKFWEPTMVQNTKELLAFLAKKEPVIVSGFKSAAYKGENFYYLSFDAPNFGLCYGVVNNLFVWTSSGESIIKTIDKIK